MEQFSLHLSHTYKILSIELLGTFFFCSHMNNHFLYSTSSQKYLTIPVLNSIYHSHSLTKMIKIISITTNLCLQQSSYFMKVLQYITKRGH